jgi:hypothetical protein
MRVIFPRLGTRLQSDDHSDVTYPSFWSSDRAVLSRHLLRDQAQSCGVLHALDTIMAQIASISERLHSRASVVLAPNEAHVDFRSE